MTECPKCKFIFPKGFSESKCPSCGIYFFKYFAAIQEREKERIAREAELAKKQAKESFQEQTEMPAPSENNASQLTAEARFGEVSAHMKEFDVLPGETPRTAACVACGGLVSITAKICPHCGQGKPAPRQKSIWPKAVALLFIFSVVFSLIDKTPRESKPKYTEKSSPRTQNIDITTITGFTEASLCRAVISTLFKQKPHIIQSIDDQSGSIKLSYSRPSDNSTWKYRCRVVGHTATWATDSGRWRNSPSDEKIYLYYTNSRLEVRVVNSDKSESVSRFAIDDLR